MSTTSANPSSKLLINLVSMIVPLVVALLLGIRTKANLGEWTQVLPHVIGGINSVTSIILVLGLLLLKAGKIEGHRWAMTSAFLLGGCFLVCYIIYHLSNPSTHYGGERGHQDCVLLLATVSHRAFDSCPAARPAGVFLRHH